MTGQNINEGLIDGEVQGALPMLAMARSHLTTAESFAPFSTNKEKNERVSAALADVNHAIEQLTVPSKATPVIEITPVTDEQSQSS